jgi:hypothetical protein
MMKLKLAVLCVVLGGPTALWAQKKAPQIVFGTGLGAAIPMGTLAERFGVFNQISGELGYLTHKHWAYSIEGLYLFNQNVREDVLAPLRNSDGDLIGINDQVASVVLRGRGYFVAPQLAYLANRPGKRGTNMWRTSLSVGYLIHRIRVQDDLTNFPQAGGVYARGYDNYTQGPALKIGTGYQFSRHNGGINYYLVAEYIMAQTTNKRQYSYTTKQPISDDPQIQSMLNIRFVWLLPAKTLRSPDDINY